MLKSIEARKNKWVQFLSGTGNQRTVYLINVDDNGDETDRASSGSIRAGFSPGARPFPEPQLINERIDWAYNNYAYEMSRVEWLGDDRVPALFPYTGTEIFAEAFGCKVHYPANDMPFALPKYVDAKSACSMKTPNVHDTPLDNIFEIAGRLRQRAGDDAIFNLPDVQSPLDIAALILNKEEFYSAMSEDPELIRDMTQKTKALLTAFLDEWFDEFGRSYIAHYPSYYMVGGMTLSEDEIGAFGPKMFDDFVLDSLNELSDRYGGIGIHSCADSEHQWGNFKKVRGLRLLNLINKPAVIKRSVRVFGDIVAMWPLDGSPESASEPAWFENCRDSDRVVLTYRAASKQSAIDIASRAEELCDRRNAAV